MEQFPVFFSRATYHLVINPPKTIDFYSYYLYNLYLNRTAAGFSDLTEGIPIPQNQLVSTEISELKTSPFPKSAVNIIINITTVDHIEGMNSPSAYLHPPNDKKTLLWL